MLDNKKLVKDPDYIISYRNNKNIGTATVTIKGKCNYTGTVIQKFTIKAKMGTSFTSGKYEYKVTGASAVTRVGIKSAKDTKVTIPKTVEYGGKTFKVTAVADKAFKNCIALKSITISGKVTKIDKLTSYRKLLKGKGQGSKVEITQHKFL